MQQKLASWFNSPMGAALLLSLLCPLLYFLGLDNELAFRRSQIGDGQWFRLMTGNLLHTNHWHLLMNLAGLWVIISLFKWPFRLPGFSLLLLALFATEGLGLYWFVPAMMGYVGLSGVLHGLFAFGACNELLNGVRFGWVLIIGVIAKVSYEMVSGGSTELASLIDAKVAVESHLVGMLAGIICALLWQWLSKRPGSNH
ncbi:rhombosortase [Shewanella corallii]|uniref:Rhombosortase n=1 Tax=Shewanella corallii TaxID=560080 RepID=A0ABT0N7H6_9GAMM|nr:rhombosortase [Shewanella corallii]MCL2914105.1 rhombosortase [Shewanella corallii]